MTNSTVFGESYAAAYDSLYMQKDYDTECRLISDTMHRYLSPQARQIADFGCGTGGHALRLARQGYDVAGVDLSPAMFERAQVKKASADDITGAVDFFQGDVATFDFGRQFDLAIMMFAVLGYQTTNEQLLATLRNMRRQLKPGGIFLADFWYGPAVLMIGPSERVRVIDIGGERIIRCAKTELDTEHHVAHVNFRLWKLRNGGLVDETDETHGMRYIFPQELSLYLGLAGFELVSLTEFPSLDQPITDRSWNAVMVARAFHG